MNKQTIEKIINETVFSLEVEGYTIPDEEKEAIREVLNGNILFSVQLQRYIDNAKRSGGILNVQPQ